MACRRVQFLGMEQQHGNKSAHGRGGAQHKRKGERNPDGLNCYAEENLREPPTGAEPGNVPQKPIAGQMIDLRQIGQSVERYCRRQQNQSECSPNQPRVFPGPTPRKLHGQVNVAFIRPAATRSRKPKPVSFMSERPSLSALLLAR